MATVISSHNSLNKPRPAVPSLAVPSLAVPSLAVPSPAVPTPGIAVPVLPAPGISLEDPHFIVASDVMRKFMGMVARVARQSGTVLITGETGTGKERIAHTIHEHSLRCSQPLVDINCAALPEHLVESELFGYEKGAFSGADITKPGLFELAHMGTIFLDEIGELDLKVQVKLLRVLDRAPYYRLGGSRKVTTDVRVVAATNRNLKEEVRAGRFRKDLYHRLSQFELYVPPLRDRAEDIAALAAHLAVQGEEPLRFSAEAIQQLQSYAWPGNVRELQNVVNKVMFSATEREISAREVRLELANCEIDTDHDHVETTQDISDSRTDHVRAQAIQKALDKTGGHRGQAAVELGISRRTLSRKLREHGLAGNRTPAPIALGSLSDQEQQHFRADIKMLATLITTDGDEISCFANNLGASGMGLEGLKTILAYRSQLRICFQFPDSDNPLTLTATLAWADKRGNAGIIFTDTNPISRLEINRWLHHKMAEEGWSIPPAAPAADTFIPRRNPNGLHPDCL